MYFNFLPEFSTSFNKTKNNNYNSNLIKTKIPTSNLRTNLTLTSIKSIPFTTLFKNTTTTSTVSSLFDRMEICGAPPELELNFSNLDTIESFWNHFNNENEDDNSSEKFNLNDEPQIGSTNSINYTSSNETLSFSSEINFQNECNNTFNSKIYLDPSTLNLCTTTTQKINETNSFYDQFQNNFTSVSSVPSCTSTSSVSPETFFDFQGLNQPNSYMSSSNQSHQNHQNQMYYPNTFIQTNDNNQNNSLSLPSFQQQNQNQFVSPKTNLYSDSHVSSTTQSFNLLNQQQQQHHQTQEDIEVNQFNFDPLPILIPETTSFESPQGTSLFESTSNITHDKTQYSRDILVPTSTSASTSSKIEINFESEKIEEEEENGNFDFFNNHDLFSLSPLASTIAPFSPSIDTESDNEEESIENSCENGIEIDEEEDEEKEDELTVFDEYQTVNLVFDKDGNRVDLEPTIDSNSFQYSPLNDTWICYRRNYLHFNASITLPSYESTANNKSLYLDQNNNEIIRFELDFEIISTENNKRKKKGENDTIQLLQFNNERKLAKSIPIKPLTFLLPTQKSNLNPYSISKPKRNLNKSMTRQSSKTSNSNSIKLTNNLAKVQFNKATLNNKRLELDYYRLKSILYAIQITTKGENEERIETGFWMSGKIVVRGRSPKDFKKQDTISFRVENSEEENEDDYESSKGKGSKKRKRGNGASVCTSKKRKGRRGGGRKKEDEEK